MTVESISTSNASVTSNGYFGSPLGSIGSGTETATSAVRLRKPEENLGGLLNGSVIKPN